MDDLGPDYVLRSDAMADLETMGKRQSYWLGRALRAEARVAELESENAGLAAAADMAHDDVITLLDTTPQGEK